MCGVLAEALNTEIRRDGDASIIEHSTSLHRGLVPVLWISTIAAWSHLSQGSSLLVPESLRCSKVNFAIPPQIVS
jgi:hypothetical protein